MLLNIVKKEEGVLPPSSYISEISFEDDKIYDFISDWQKMREVHSKCIIDNEMYDLWIEKTLRNYNTAINRESLPFD